MFHLFQTHDFLNHFFLVFTAPLETIVSCENEGFIVYLQLLLGYQKIMANVYESIISGKGIKTDQENDMVCHAHVSKYLTLNHTISSIWEYGFSDELNLVTYYVCLLTYKSYFIYVTNQI